MSVQRVERKANPYVVRWRDADGHHRSRSFPTRKAATAFDRTVRSDADSERLRQQAIDLRAAADDLDARAGELEASA